MKLRFECKGPCTVGGCSLGHFCACQQWNGCSIDKDEDIANVLAGQHEGCECALVAVEGEELDADIYVADE